MEACGPHLYSRKDKCLETERADGKEKMCRYEAVSGKTQVCGQTDLIPSLVHYIPCDCDQTSYHFLMWACSFITGKKITKLYDKNYIIIVIGIRDVFEMWEFTDGMRKHVSL